MNCPACNEEDPGEGAFCSTCGESLGDSDCLPPGTLLMQGAYQIETVLGQGGFGITYRAQDNNLHRAVAIKEFFPTGCRRAIQRVSAGGTWSKSTYQEARQRFLEEGRTLARFNHPGIVRVFAAFEENETAYIVMELLNGLSLAGLLEQRGRLPESEALDVIRRVGAALEEVHRLDLLHRDIKPANILLCEDGRIALVDFGTARQFASGVTSKHSVMLTPGYAPMEQYAERGRRGPYTDVYSLAATLYHLLSGSFPESATDRAAGLPLTDLAVLCPELSPPVAAAVARGMQMDIAQRPQTVAEFLSLLRLPEAALEVAAPKPPPETKPASPAAPPQPKANPVAVVEPSLPKAKPVTPLAQPQPDRPKPPLKKVVTPTWLLVLVGLLGTVSIYKGMAGSEPTSPTPRITSPTPAPSVSPPPRLSTDDDPTPAPSTEDRASLSKNTAVDETFLALYQALGVTSQGLSGFELGVSSKDDVKGWLDSFPRTQSKKSLQGDTWEITYSGDDLVDDLVVQYAFTQETLRRVCCVWSQPEQQGPDPLQAPFYKALKSRLGEHTDMKAIEGHLYYGWRVSGDRGIFCASYPEGTYWISVLLVQSSS